MPVEPGDINQGWTPELLKLDPPLTVPAANATPAIELNVTTMSVATIPFRIRKKTFPTTLWPASSSFFIPIMGGPERKYDVPPKFYEFNLPRFCGVGWRTCVYLSGIVPEIINP